MKSPSPGKNGQILLSFHAHSAYMWMMAPVKGERAVPDDAFKLVKAINIVQGF